MTMGRVLRCSSQEAAAAMATMSRSLVVALWLCSSLGLVASLSDTVSIFPFVLSVFPIFEPRGKIGRTETSQVLEPCGGPWVFDQIGMVEIS